MDLRFNSDESLTRGYSGIAVDEATTKAHFSGPVKDSLVDQPQVNSLLVALVALKEETGFEQNDLLLDIQALNKPEISVPAWRIGEAITEVFLEKNMQCRFHWNELRDARNPRGNKTGADLVGFIEIEDQVLFLFGEVKTSSETSTRPPQVMTYKEGIENQLKDLHNNRSKRMTLISYLQSKTGIDGTGVFKADFDAALKNYYATDNLPYKLFGVLVRDVDVDEQDLKKSYERLKTAIPAPIGLRLMALYMPFKKSTWLSMINA